MIKPLTTSLDPVPEARKILHNKMKQVQLALLLTTACLFKVNFAAKYDYSPTSGKGPDKWATLFPTYCSKSKQSPVNIVAEEITYDSDLNNITFTGYSMIPPGPTLEIANNGHSFVVTVKPKTFSIKDGGLSSTYNLHSFHLHWGSTNDNGGEHTLDKKRYAAELHLVHFNNKYADLSSALGHSDGLAVLGIWLDLGKENAALESFFKYAPNVTDPSKLHNITQTESLDKLLPADPSAYYRYQGSLTTPDCQEVVTWTVFKNPLQFSEDQLKHLRSLKYEKNGTDMVDNHRPVQPLNGRVVKTSIQPSGGAHLETSTIINFMTLVVLFKLLC